MAPAPDPAPRSRHIGAKSLLCVILLVAIVTAAAAVYALVERRGAATQTPGGVNYSPTAPNQ